MSDYVRKIKPEPPVEPMWEAGMAVGSEGGDGADGIQTNHDRAYEREGLPDLLDDRLDNPEGWLWSVDGVDNINGNVDFIAGAGMSIVPNNVTKTITFIASGGGGDNYTVMCSSNDTTPGFLEDKLVTSVGTNTTDILETTTLNDGANERVQVQLDTDRLLQTYVGVGKIDLPPVVWDDTTAGATWRIIGKIPVWAFSASALRYIRHTTRLPVNVDLTTINPRLVIDYAPADNQTSGDQCRWRAQMTYITNGELLTKAIDETVAISADVPTAQDEKDSVVIELDRTLMAAGDLVSIEISRNISHVDDDRNGEIYISYVKLLYEKAALDEGS